MIDRYARSEMKEIWTDAGRYRRWLEVELAVCEVHAERGLIPREALETIRAKAAVDPARVAEIEAEVRHDVIAFLTDVAEHVGPEARFVHFGMTSSDVLDTSLALQIRDAGRLLQAGVERVCDALRRRALEFKHTPCIGRTHGVHAEPTTFGLKLLVFYAEMRRQSRRLERALAEAAVGKISGAVGTFAHLPPEVEEAVCGRLGIGFEPAATQVVQRDRHAAFIGVLALIASSLEKFAVELRHLARTEVREVQEEFGAGQKGSSAMPHKRNPWRLENITGLARVLRGYASAALENQALWHERDISNSSVERIVFPDATTTLDFMLQRFAGLVETLVVFPDRMRENLELTRGLAFSGTLLLALAEKGLAREAAYALVQGHAMATWDHGGDYRERVLADPQITALLTKEDVDRAFSLEEALRHVDAIFARTLAACDGEAGAASRKESS
ncbi:MAG: adenylosuccinate lyase [Myxococcales bacterium]|nr:adenylosuccinate lyase [Myxococcales bacterium]MDH5306092.1 adenylosuccinate lyase [Myxococcales bacterium]MDH5566065.1 adenylosuccinate lyase [Myxococcales bacterium]